VFFAVTYDGTRATGNAQFFFGTPGKAAEPDSAAMDYDGGKVDELSVLTVGNVSADAGGRQNIGSADSRVFRGLLDEIELFYRVLTLEEIQQAQRSPAPRAVGFQPRLSIRVEGAEVVLEWESAGNFPVQRCISMPPRWMNQPARPEVDGFRYVVRLPFSWGTRQLFYRLAP
jgi:hypothetical protein